MRKKDLWQIFLLTCFITSTIFILFLGYCFWSNSNTIDENFDSSKGPLILAYNAFFGLSFFDSSTIEGLETCEYKCQYSDNKLLYPYANVAIFHGPEVYMDSMLSSKNNSNRFNLFFSMESEPHASLPNNIPKDFFNLTMTFRRDSTFWFPYDKFEEFKPHEKDNKELVWSEKDVDEIIGKKSELALQFVSNCNTHSKRETYLTELQNYMNLTIYGKCNRHPFPKVENKMFFKEFEKHYFYLAFENSVCADYVTEKFWRLKHLIVPVVLKRSILKGIVDDKYFIAADDFNSPKELSERLMNLTKNPEEYKKYFGWTKIYKKTAATFKVKNFCKLCEAATKKEKHSIKDIHEWWKIDSKCEEKFAVKIGGKEISWIFYLFYVLLNLF